MNRRDLARRVPFAEQSLALAIVSLQGLFVFAVAVIAWRVIVGPVAGQLSAPFAILSAAAVACIAASFHRFNQARAMCHPDRLAAVLPTIGVGGFLVALVGSGAAPVAITVGAALLVAEEWAIRRYPCPVRLRRLRQATVARTAIPLAEPALIDNDRGETIWQELTRAETAEGNPYWRGLLRGRLAPQQRLLHLHVAFCPAFAQSPDVAVEQVDGAAATVRVDTALPQGARIEIRLERESVAVTDVLVEFIATVPSHLMETE